jgi:PAS domain S-box-containing protein
MKDLLKILLLEDNVNDAELIQRFLSKENLNCEFSLAINKRTYVEALNLFQPTVILSDHSLPQFDSEEAFIIARKKFPDIPFIMVTGSVSEEFAAEMIKMGVDDYVLKDRMARLPAAITKAVQRRRAEKEKREAEQKVKQSETNLRTIFETTSEGFILLDTHARILTFNNKATDYAPFVKKDFQIGQSIYDFVEDSRQEIFKKNIEKSLRGESIQYDRFYEMENGRIFWIDFYVTPVIEAGAVTGICIAARDITEKKRIEQEREFDRNNLKALINNTNDLMWSVDREFRLITSNNAFDKMVVALSGSKVEKGDSVFPKGFSKEQLDRFKEYYMRAFAGQSFTELEYTEFPYELWSEISYYPIYHENTVIGAACFSRDITLRKKAEKEITDYRNALDQSAIVSITDEKGIIKHVNNNFCRISGYTAAELLDQDHRIVNLGYHSKAFIKNLWATITNGKIWRGELCNKAKNGALYWVDATIVPFLNDKGKPVQYVGISNDITEKKMMEQKLTAQKIEEQKKIARAIIITQEKERNYIGQELHDNINQILASAKMYLEMEGNKKKEVKESVRYPMELIGNSIEEIRLLCQELVTPRKNIDLEELVKALIAKFEENTTIKAILYFSISKNILRDDLRLNIYRIVQEQLNNIAKHADAKKVRISIQANHGIVTVVVEDDGKGFDVNKKRKGIGISNMINRIESFNGEITIASSAGKGCKTEINIPY